MNHIFKKIWNKSLGRIIVVSENAKSAGKTDNTTGTTENSLSNAHDDERGKNGVFSFKPFVLQSLALSVAMILGGNTQANDNYAHATTDTALGSAKGIAHTTTTTAGKITAVGGITVTTDPATAGTSLDDIDSFTADGVQETDPIKVAAFKNAAKKGGNIAVGSVSSAVGTANIASGWDSSAVGFKNNASGGASSAVGSDNTASGNYGSAVGNQNTASGHYSSAVGYNNNASGTFSSAMGSENNASGQSSSAVGRSNQAKGQAANAFGIENTVDHGVSDTDPFIGDGTGTGRATANAFGSSNHVTGAGATANKKGAIAFAGWYDQNADNQIGDASLIASETAAATGVSSVAIGAGVTATADRSSVFGVGSQATALNATAIGFDSLADEANTISVGRAGAEKRITNVKAGTADTDAVNKKTTGYSISQHYR